LKHGNHDIKKQLNFLVYAVLSLEVVGLERGPLSLVRITEELLE
jgi:hypothetical protein